ncbi:hypothetical protein H9634_14305, partial [Brevibacterium sp. Re57]|nr:hypothetical protein [Brevibacterium gallinarum]
EDRVGDLGLGGLCWLRGQQPGASQRDGRDAGKTDAPAPAPCGAQ